MTDLLGGQVDFMCDQTTNTTSQIKGGEVKAYAVTTPSGWRACPTCRPPPKPACRTSRSASGTASTRRPARPRTSSPKLNAALQAALAGPEVIDALRRARHRAGGRRTRRRPRRTRETLAARSTLWKPIIEAAGVRRQ